MDKTTVNDSLNSLYDNYYDNDSKTLIKRNLTALDTVEHIQSVCDISQSQRILDVGAGEGSLLDCLSKLNYDYQLYGVEISTSGIRAINFKKIPKLVEVLQFDGYTIPYPDKFFDIAICIHVLEHVEHERLFIKELKRVANRVIIEVPLEHTFKVGRAIEIGELYGHINFYTVDTLLNILKTCQIKIDNFRVLTFSRKFEIFISGRFKGLFKHIIRNMALNLFPKIAPAMMVYFLIVVCEDSSTT